MFTIKRPPHLAETIKVRVPGERAPQTFAARFKYLDLKERRAFVERIADAPDFSDEQVVAELMVGFDGVRGEDGAPLEFNDKAVATLMQIPFVADALLKVVMERVLGGALSRKN